MWRGEDEVQVQFPEGKDGWTEGAAVTKNVHPGDMSPNHVRKDVQKSGCVGNTKAQESRVTLALSPVGKSCAFFNNFEGSILI